MELASSQPVGIHRELDWQADVVWELEGEDGGTGGVGGCGDDPRVASARGHVPRVVVEKRGAAKFPSSYRQLQIEEGEVYQGLHGLERPAVRPTLPVLHSAVVSGLSLTMVGLVQHPNHRKLLDPSRKRAYTQC